MRLKKEEILNIKNIISKFDIDAKIYLFGSRVDDSKKGGDIDLLIVSFKINLTDKLKIKLELYKVLGEQKIDLLIVDDVEKDNFTKIAFSEGILL